MKTLQTILLFLTASLLFAACGPDTKEPLEPNPIPQVKDSEFENRTWQLMGYGHTDSTQLNLPEDASQYTLILSDSLLFGTTTSGNFTAKYTLFTDKKISINSLTGTGINESPYIKALQELRTAYKYEIHNEALKIFYSVKQYILFVEKNKQYPKEINEFRYFNYNPFKLSLGEQLIINSKAELLKRCIDPDFPIDTINWKSPYGWAEECCYSFDLNSIDFSNSTLIVGCCSIDNDPYGMGQKITQLGKNTYLYTVKVQHPYTCYGAKILYYGIVLDNKKIMDNATIIHSVHILHNSSCNQ